MKIFYLLFSLALCLCPVMRAQNTTERTKLLQAYQDFSEKGDYKQAIDAGTKAAFLYYSVNQYQEAFELCREMNRFILSEEQKSREPLYEQRFQVTNERLEMYIRLKNPAQAQAQLNTLANLAGQAGDERLSNRLLYTQAGYHYTFGQIEQGDAAFQKLINQYKEKKEYDKVSDCYRNLIAIARKSNNAPLMERTYEKYIVWTDSVKALSAKEQMDALQQKYDQSLQTIQEKDDTLSVKQYTIVGLITFAAILIAALLFLGFLLLRLIVSNKKLKAIIRTTNEHSEQQARFIQDISAQMEPTLDKLGASANELRATAPRQAGEVSARIEALRRFAARVQELSSLENTLMEPYEASPFNVGNFCQKIVEKIKEDVRPEVNLVTDVPQLEIKTNAEHLERILSHLLKNAASYTSSGNIRLEFKRKGAHVCQFIVTDNGTGIPDERQETLFKPFNRPRDLAQGDGLGLPLCALMANKLNGTLSIDKEYKKGCRFVLVLQI